MAFPLFYEVKAVYVFFAAARLKARLGFLFDQTRGIPGVAGSPAYAWT
jgi:hypothetical protein